MRFAVLAMLLAQVWSAPGASAQGDRSHQDDVTGFWTGDLHHNGETSVLGLRLEPAGDGAIGVRLSLPEIDLWNLPVGNAVLDGDTLRLGSWWRMHYDRRERTLTGVLPAALVPVYRIPFVLAPAETIPQPPPSEIAAPTVDPVWTFRTQGPVWAGVSCAGGRVYAGSDDGSLYALDAGTGEPVWTFPTAGPIRARPTVAANRVLLNSDDGFLYALDALTGTELWRAQLLDEPRSRRGPGESMSPYDHHASSPAVVDGMVYVGAGDGGVHALEFDSGERRWRFRAAGAVDGTPAVGGGSVYVGSMDGSVYALDAGDGDVRWSHDTGAPIVASPALGDGRVLIGSRSYDILAVDAATGERVWDHYVWFSWVESVVAAGSTAFVGTSDAQRLYALDIEHGTPRWNVDTGGSVWSGAALGRQAVFVGSVGVADYMVDHQGGFLAVDLEGNPLWRHPVARPDSSLVWGFASTPAVAEGRVYVGGLDGRVWAFRQAP